MPTRLSTPFALEAVPFFGIYVWFASATEGDALGAYALYQVIYDFGISPLPVTVDYVVAPDGPTPASADDFVGGVFPSGTITLTLGVHFEFLYVRIAGDFATEADEGFTVTLLNPSAGVALGNAVVSGAILDDDRFGIFGTPRGDLLVGTEGVDRIKGYDGDDTMVGGAGADTFEGGNGFDVVSYRAASVGLSISLAPPSEGAGNEADGDAFNAIERIVGSSFDDTITGYLDTDDLRGGAGDDLLLGASANFGNQGDYDDDTLSGGAGQDRLFGGLGNDLVLGASGDDLLSGGQSAQRPSNDTLMGGRGVDTLIGGDGADTFVLDAPRGGRDTIQDFVTGFDRIELAAAAFARFLPAGELAAAHFALGAATDAVPQLIYDQATGVLLWDRDGTGDAGALAIARLNHGPELTAADIVVIA